MEKDQQDTDCQMKYSNLLSKLYFSKAWKQLESDLPSLPKHFNSNLLDPEQVQTTIEERNFMELKLIVQKMSNGVIDREIELAEKLVAHLRARKNEEQAQAPDHLANPTAAEDTSRDTEIVNNVQEFLNLSSLRKDRHRNQHLTQVLRGIWAALSGPTTSSRFLASRLAFASTHRLAMQGKKDREAIKEAIGEPGSKNIFCQIIGPKKREDSTLDIAHKYIYRWQHDDDVSRVESNSSSKFLVFNPETRCNEHHNKRSYNTRGFLDCHFNHFRSSHYYRDFVREVENNEKKGIFFVEKAPSISKTTFRRCLCKCVGDPTTHSCIDLKNDKVYLKGVAMEEFMFQERQKYENESDDEEQAEELYFFSQIDNCKCDECERYRTKFNTGDSAWTSIFRRESGKPITLKLIKKCLCPKQVMPDLRLDSENEMPRFYKWECAISKCDECGIDSLPWGCEKIINCTSVIPVQVWEDSPRSGGTSQVEIVDKELPVSEIMSQLKLDLKELLRHHVDLQRFRRMKDLNIQNQKESELLLYTDFAAMLSYRANKTICGQQDHHGVLQIFYVLSNPRDILIIRDENGSTTTKRVRDCEVFYFFGGTEDRGKKHDWVFHNACLDFIINKKKEELNEKNIEINAVSVYSDNCKGQYKCRQNFYNLSKIPLNHSDIKTAEHFFAPVYGFKGPWDAAGKVAKYLANQLEKREIRRVQNAFQHYEVFEEYIAKTDTKNWEQLEIEGDDSLLARTPFTSTKRHSIYVTDHQHEFNLLREKGVTAVFTNRAAREINDDTQAYPSSDSFYHAIGYGQIEGNSKVRIEFREKFCFCSKCNGQGVERPNIANECMCKSYIGKATIIDRSPATSQNDSIVNKLLGYQILPSFELMWGEFSTKDLKVLVKLMGFSYTKDIRRADNRKGVPPLKKDVIDFLLMKFNECEWDAIKNLVTSKWQEMREAENDFLE